MDILVGMLIIAIVALLLIMWFLTPKKQNNNPNRIAEPLPPSPDAIITDKETIVRIPESYKQFQISNIYTSSDNLDNCEIKVCVFDANGGWATDVYIYDPKQRDGHYFFKSGTNHPRINNNGINIFTENKLPPNTEIYIYFIQTNYRS